MGKNKKQPKQQQQQQPLQQHSPKQISTEEEIRLLKEQVDQLTNRVQQLESFKLVSLKITDALRKEIDRLDQYGRRHSVVIRNVEKPDNETQEQVEAKVNSLITTTLKSPNVTKDI